MTTGIYALYWPKSSMIYIGRGTSIEARWRSHTTFMTTNTHYNKKIQNQYNIYGLPEYHILEECTIDHLDILEITWISEFDSVASGLNIHPGGGYSSSGTTATRSKYSRKDVLKVFSMLSKGLSIGDIESRYGSKPRYLANNILYNGQHLWLQSEFTDRYSSMIFYRDSVNKTNKVTSKLGLSNPGAKYTKRQILKIFSLLYKTTLSRAKIANRCKVNEGVVKGIREGSHIWLRDCYPEQYASMVLTRSNLKGRRGPQS